VRTPFLTGILVLLLALSWPGVARQAVPVRVVVSVDGTVQRFDTEAGTLRQVLAQAGAFLQEGDRLLLAGSPLEPDGPLPDARPVVLQVQRAVRVEIPAAGQEIHTAAPTLAEAMWQAGIGLRLSDRLDPRPQSAPRDGLVIAYQAAVPLNIQVGDSIFQGRSAARQIGTALQGAGLALQGLDYSLPAADQPLPQDGNVEVVRVREEIILEQESLPFETLFQPAPEVEIDQQQVLQAGAFGLQVRRVRVRYENEIESRREVEAEWTAVEPRARIIGYGTDIVVRTIDTPQGTLEYWRAVPAFATSYSPCRLGTDFCGDTTASGLPLEKGVVGVVRAWYNAMVFSKVFVQGYGVGTIADIGAGVAGQHWIDLGYSDGNWQQWAGQVTVYFLTPVPPADQILWILP
jgi:uncharacterized protein YabE (DUF348 family)